MKHLRFVLAAVALAVVMSWAQLATGFNGSQLGAPYDPAGSGGSGGGTAEWGAPVDASSGKTIATCTFAGDTPSLAGGSTLYAGGGLLHTVSVTSDTAARTLVGWLCATNSVGVCLEMGSFSAPTDYHQSVQLFAPAGYYLTVCASGATRLQRWVTQSWTAGGAGSISGLTTNATPKADSATSLTNSGLTWSGTAATFAGTTTSTGLLTTAAGLNITGGQTYLAFQPAGTTSALGMLRLNLPSGGSATDKIFVAQNDTSDLLTLDRSGLFTLTGSQTVSGTLGATGIVTLGNTVTHSFVSPTALSGDVNNYAGCDGKAICNIDSGGVARNITGMTAAAQGTVRVLCAQNSAGTLTFKYDSASSTAANRFFGKTTYGDWTLIGPQCVNVVYKNARWCAY